MLISVIVNVIHSKKEMITLTATFTKNPTVPFHNLKLNA